MASPNEKDAETMPTQKIFKRQVRARMTKTGESYTTARHQLLRKSTDPKLLDRAPAAPADVIASTTPTATPTDIGPVPTAAGSDIPAHALMVAEEAMRRATGKDHGEWFAILDAWGASGHTHTEIARWLGSVQGVPSWWTQSITVSYERARGLRARHQQVDGFTVNITRTIAVDPDIALRAFTSEPSRRRWFPGAPLRQRPTRAALTARFDWTDPVSRVVVTVVPRGAGKATVAVAHERIPDAQAAERLKADWRARLGSLKAVLERA